MVWNNLSLRFLQSNPAISQRCFHDKSEDQWQTAPPPVKSFVSQHRSKRFLTTGIFWNGTVALSACWGQEKDYFRVTTELLLHAGRKAVGSFLTSQQKGSQRWKLSFIYTK